MNSREANNKTLSSSTTSTKGSSGASGRPPLTHSHSTHAPLETFDQATRDAAAAHAAHAAAVTAAGSSREDREAVERNEQRSSSTSSPPSRARYVGEGGGGGRLDGSAERTHAAADVGGRAVTSTTPGRLGDSGAAFDINDAYILQANSAVQLDRDVRQSRRLVDDSKQKGVHGQTPSAEAIPPSSNDNVYIE